MKFLKILLVTLCVSCSPQTVHHSEPSQFPERPQQLMGRKVQFQPARPERWELANGLVVYYLHDQAIPLMQGQLFVPGGSYLDPKQLPGLATATGSQLREGGTEELTPAELDTRLDTLAASIQSSIGLEMGTIEFSSLSEDFDEVFRLFHDVVRKPGFNAQRLSLWKSLALEGIRRRRDDPAGMAEMAINDLVYGKDTALNHNITEGSVRRISTNDMLRFVRTWFRPNGAVLAISGSLPRERVAAAVEREFGAWPRSAVAIPAPPAVTHRPKPGIYLLERDFQQATVLMGHIGPQRLTPDMFAISILNRYFSSGSFGSVLFQEVRSKRGLAYAVDGGVAPGFGAGIFQLYVATRVTEVSSAIREILKQVDLVRTNPPEQDRLGLTKSSVERGFVFNFDTPEKIVNRASLLEMYRYPSNFDATYLERMRAVSGEEVTKAAQTRIRPEDLIIVVVGRVSEADLRQAFGAERQIYRFTFDTEPRF